MVSMKRNPKELWSCVNDLMEKQKGNPSADTGSSVWTNYFKSLTNIDYPNKFMIECYMNTTPMGLWIIVSLIEIYLMRRFLEK